MDIKVIVATHKKYQMPYDSMYLPVQVGAEGKEKIGYQGDNEGENISTKNPYYCELTGLYWGWKNLDCDYLGLVHYRRHFSIKKEKNKFDSILTKEQAEQILQTTDVILPKKRHYVIETIKSHYAHTHYENDLKLTRDIISKDHPDYLEYFDKCMNSRSSHMFNMFIMKKHLANDYLTFIFDILQKLENEVDYKNYSAFQARLFGRISEVLLDVWIQKNNIQYKEIRCIHMEPVNWIVKGGAFLKAKFFGKKYGGSF